MEGSSNSSLSSNIESPSVSSEAIPDTTTTNSTTNVSMHSKSGSIGGASVIARDFIEDDDDDVMPNEADWSSKIPSEKLDAMTDVEKKRQEIINEIYITERNHVRNLRLLSEIFMRPLQTLQIISDADLNLLFPPSMSALLGLHATFEYSIKLRRQEHEFCIREIGDILLTMFGGGAEVDLKKYGADFCARQQIALERLRELRKKNEQLNRFLQNAESHKACRRLQLKDLLPTVLQRLTKYPLLFDSLHKVTMKLNDGLAEEAASIAMALDSSKDILNHVNQEVRSTEDKHKLEMIQKKLDISGFDKESAAEYKNLDLTKHKLLHDGLLNLKRNPNIQLHGLLFEDKMVLLQKQDEKYILKFHPSGEKSSDNKTFNPVMKINTIIVRQCAVEKNSFFLINTNVSQMLELSAPSSTECKNWFRHISDAHEAYKQPNKKNSDISRQDKDVPENASNALSPIDKTESTFEQCTTPDEKTEEAAPVTSPPPLPPSSSAAAEPDPDGCNESIENDKTDRSDKTNIHQNNNHHPHRQVILNNSRQLTQQSSLIAPSEIRITQNDVLVADRIINTEERLKRLDHELRAALLQKQEIVCDMFNVPYNDFQVIVDIAGQTEAPKEPTELLLAAFAQIQTLTEIVSDHMNVTNGMREIAARSNSLCDTCYHNQVAMKNDRNNSTSSTSVAVAAAATATNINEVVRAMEDEDGYCEIEDIRSEILHNNLDNSRTSDASLNESKVS